MRISTVVIRNARPIAEPHLDQSEELALELVPVEDIPALIKSGQIDHGVCVAGLLWWLMLPGHETLAMPLHSFHRPSVRDLFQADSSA